MGKRKVPKGRDNKIGFRQNQDNRKEALNLLDKITAQREKEGYVWVMRGSTNKQISPEKLKDHLDDGWKMTKRNGK